MRVTASGLERALRCRGSRHLPTISSTSGAAERGTWRHAFLARVQVVGADAALAEVPDEHRDACAALPLDELPTDLTAELAFGYDVASGKARIIGTNLERNYGVLGDAEIAGAADVVGLRDQPLAGRSILVLDWKSIGHRARARDSIQLRFLALAASRAYGIEAVRVEIVRLGDGGEVYRDWHAYEALDLDVFAAELRAWHAVLPDDHAGDDFHEGPWCDRCPSFAYCPAKSLLALEVAEGRVLDTPVATMPLSPERAGIAWQRAKLARKMIEHVERACIATLEEHGSLPLPDGKSLVRRTVPGNEKLAGEVVYQVVTEKHGAELARRAVEMTATKAGLKEALRPLGTKRGQLTRLESEVLDEVRKRGGASRGTRVAFEEVDLIETAPSA